MPIRFGTLILVYGTIGVTSVLAQTHDPIATGRSASDVPSSASGDESLSAKLSKSGGVIKPKTDVDPGIKAKAPDPNPGSTPVIPPAATGGNSAK